MKSHSKATWGRTRERVALVDVIRKTYDGERLLTLELDGMGIMLQHTVNGILQMPLGASPASERLFNHKPFESESCPVILKGYFVPNDLIAKVTATNTRNDDAQAPWSAKQEDLREELRFTNIPNLILTMQKVKFLKR